MRFIASIQRGPKIPFRHMIRRRILWGMTDPAVGIGASDPAKMATVIDPAPWTEPDRGVRSPRSGPLWRRPAR
jgi:hypothetical protein